MVCGRQSRAGHAPVVIFPRMKVSPGRMPNSIPYCLPGMSPKRMMTASSASSSIFIRTRCHGSPFTLTDSPFARTSETTWDDSRLEHSVPEIRSSSSDDEMLRDGSESSSAACSAGGLLGRRAMNVKGEDKMKVVDTEVISRTERDSVGLQGLIECQFAKSSMAIL